MEDAASSNGRVLIRSCWLYRGIAIVNPLLIGGSTLWTTAIAGTTRRAASDAWGDFALFAHCYLAKMLPLSAFWKREREQVMPST